MMCRTYSNGFADSSWKLESKAVNPIFPLPYRVYFLVYCDICESAVVILLTFYQIKTRAFGIFGVCWNRRFLSYVKRELVLK